jgi:hypothetical protein
LSTQVYAFTRHRVRLFNDDTKGNTFWISRRDVRVIWDCSLSRYRG